MCKQALGDTELVMVRYNGPSLEFQQALWICRDVTAIVTSKVCLPGTSLWAATSVHGAAACQHIYHVTLAQSHLQVAELGVLDTLHAVYMSVRP